MAGEKEERFYFPPLVQQQQQQHWREIIVPDRKWLPLTGQHLDPLSSRAGRKLNDAERSSWMVKAFGLSITSQFGQGVFSILACFT